MSVPNPYQQYRQTMIMTATAPTLVTMTMDAFLKELDRARQAIEAQKWDHAHDSLTKAQEIVLALQGALDRRVGELAARLDAIYDYMYRRLVEANVKKDAAIVEEIRRLMDNLRDAWVQASRLAG